MNILITSIAGKVPMIKAVKKAAAKFNSNLKVFGADSSSDAPGRYFVDIFWHMPVLSELTPGLFLSYCKDNNIRFVIPSRDGDLSFLAENRDLFAENGVFAMVSSEKSINICRDKMLFSKKIHGAIPSSFSLSEIGACDCVIKERFGSGSDKIKLKVTPQKAEILAASFDNPIFQPFIKGAEYSVDIYRNLENRTFAVARLRKTIKHGESIVTETVFDSELEEAAIKIADNLELYGHNLIQIIKNEDGLHVVECNNRFGGASTVAIEAGLDSFYMFIVEASGGAFPEFARKNKNILQLRVSEDYYFTAGI